MATRRHRAANIIVAAALMAGCTAPTPTGPGSTGGRLMPCPDTPNCVCSEFPGAAAIPPLGIEGDADAAWRSAVNAVRETGGSIQTLHADYLHATYTSRVFRFVDDLELRLDRTTGVIHVRSASRLGYSDLGVNRRRVARLRQIYSNAPAE